MTQKPPDPKTAPGIDPIIQEMHSQNERGAAITGGVYLENKLQEAIELRWPQISNTVRNSLFEGYGPLSSFSAKILVAHAVGVLNVHSQSDCHKIRLIRNHAAHIGTPFSFSSEKIKSHLASVRCLGAIALDKSSDSDGRNQFTTVVKTLAAYLFFQENWKAQFGFKSVMPDFVKTPSKNR